MAYRAFWHYQHEPSLLALLCCRTVLQTISDMVIYNRSRRDARRRFKMRNMKERQMMKFKVGTAQRQRDNYFLPKSPLFDCSLMTP
jgi:hypothetical protein